MMDVGVTLPQSQGTPEAARSWKARKDPPLMAWREHGPAETLTLDCSFQNCKTINFCCSKPPSLRYFVTAA